MEERNKEVIGLVFATMLLSILLLISPCVLGDSLKVVHQPIELVDYNQTGNASELVFIAPTESRSVQTPLARGEIEIKYDDGVTNSSTGGFGWKAAVRFTPPSYPVYLNTARLYVGELPFEDYGVFHILVYDDDGSNGEPGTLLGQVSNIIVPSWPPIWYDVDLSGFGITITSGDFYIAFYPYHYSHQALVGIDKTSPDYRSFKFNSSESWNLVTDHDYMIRAIVDTGGGEVYKDYGVYRGGQWFLRTEDSPLATIYNFWWGHSYDRPITGDWNGDGTDTIGVYRDGRWLLSNSITTPSVDHEFWWGWSTDTPVTGDWI